MKQVYILLIGFLVISCSNQIEKRTTISVLEDRTENDFIAKPNPSDLISTLDIDLDIWADYRFRYGQLTDMEHTRKYEISIDSKFSLFENEFKRKKEITEESTLYVFSDLRENAPWFSSYRYRDSIQLVDHSEQVAKLYVQKAESFTVPINVEMVIVFEPKTILEDISFAKQRELYKGVCETLGIPVRFTANLNPK